VKLVNLEGVRVTYLSRRSGQVIRTEDTVKGRVEFRTAGATTSARALDSGYTVALTQMRGGMGGGRAGAGGRAGGGAARTSGQAGSRTGQSRTTTGQQSGARRIPASLDYGFRLTTELVAK
jgi:hypothetical protein